MFLILTLIIPFSRLYLCVHTPLDLIASFVIFLAVAYLNSRILPWSHGDERRRLYTLLGYLAVTLIFAAVTDFCSGKPMSNRLVGFCIGMTVGMIVQERFIGYEVPSLPLKDTVIAAIPGILAVCLLFAVPMKLSDDIGFFIGGLLSMIFATVVYPYILKRWVLKTDEAGAGA